jgi:hypothetical protein
VTFSIVGFFILIGPTIYSSYFTKTVSKEEEEKEDETDEFTDQYARMLIRAKKE